MGLKLTRYEGETVVINDGEVVVTVDNAYKEAK